MSPRKFLGSHPLACWTVGLSLSFFCGLSLGRGGWSRGNVIAKAPPREAVNRGVESIQMAGRVPDGPSERRTKALAVSKEDSKELARMVRSIFRENIKQRRVARFEKLVETTGVEHLPELISLIRENDLRGNDSGDEWTRLWIGWGERDPQAAMDFVQKFDWSEWDPNARGEAQNRTLTNWAQTDPEAALRFVEGDRNFMNGDRTMVYGLVEGWSNANPEAAADWLFKSGLAMGAEYEKVVNALTRKGGQEGLDAWFSELDLAKVPAKDQAGFAQAIARIKQEYEPDKAAAWIQKHLGEPWVEESEIVGSTARAFAQRDPKSAIEWAGKTGLDQAQNIVISTWCEQDVSAAGKWMLENAARPEHFQSAALVMSHLQQMDPAVAREWADSIPDTTLRQRLLAH